MPSPRSHTSALDAVFRLAAGNKSYVLRHYRTDSPERIDLHNRFLLWAGKSKLKSIQAIIRTSDSRLDFDFNQRKWWLANFIEADQAYTWDGPLWSSTDCQYAGAALSTLHEGLRRFSRDEQIRAGSADSSIVSTLEKSLSTGFAQAETFKSHAYPAMKILRQAQEVIRRTQNRKSQLVHGDFHPGNILLQESKVVGIIDFEYLHFEDYVYDVAYGLVMFGPRWTDGEDDGVLDVAFVQSFLKGYGNVDNDPLLLPYMRIAAAVCLSWLLEREFDKRKAMHFINVLSHLQNFSTIDFSSR